jgi:hypothetical protein
VKRYLYFQTLNSSFDLLTPQYVFCGSPKIVALNPQSNAINFLWEQLEPNPLLFPVTFSPNNTSKDVTVIIPNNIVDEVKLKVTLNGDINNFRIVDIKLSLIDPVIGHSSGTGLVIHNNTLNDALPFVLAPIPLQGPQVINYTSNIQTTGVKFFSQSYRQSYTDKIDIYNNNNVFIQELDVFKTIYEDLLFPDDRINLNVNTTYNILKKWTDIKVLSQEIVPIPQVISMSYPNIIADEYITSCASGTGLVSYSRTPFIVANQVLEESLNNDFSPGTGLVSYSRTPFTMANQLLEEILNNNFSPGTGLVSFTRTPYTSNIIG